MAQIDVKRVKARYKGGFEDVRKDLAEMLKPMRSFFKKISIVRTSKTGRSTAYKHMTQLTPDTLNDARHINQQIKTAIELAEQSGLTEYASENVLEHYKRFQTYCNAIVTWVMHFAELNGKSPAKAYKSVVHHRAAVLELFDNALGIASLFCTDARRYVDSNEFAAHAVDPESCVVIAPKEIKGTKEEVRAYLERNDPDLLAETAEVEAAVREIIDSEDSLPEEGDEEGDEDEEGEEGDEDEIGTEEEADGGAEPVSKEALAAKELAEECAALDAIEAPAGIVCGTRRLRKRNFASVDLYEYAAQAEPVSEEETSDENVSDNQGSDEDDDDAATTTEDEEEEDADDSGEYAGMAKRQRSASDDDDEEEEDLISF